MKEGSRRCSNIQERNEICARELYTGEPDIAYRETHGQIIKEEIASHLDRYDLLNDTQHEFMRGRSCLTNLLTYIWRV